MNITQIPASDVNAAGNGGLLGHLQALLPNRLSYTALAAVKSKEDTTCIRTAGIRLYYSIHSMAINFGK